MPGKRKSKISENISEFQESDNNKNGTDTVTDDEALNTSESDYLASARIVKDIQKENRIKDVSTYIMSDELESRIAIYEDDDPVFSDHVRRAHKYSRLPSSQGKPQWKTEVKGLDDSSDRYSRLFFCRRENIPTPDEMREAGVSGKVRFVLTYYDIYKVNKNGRSIHGVSRGGLVSILSRPIELPALNTSGSPSPIPQQNNNQIYIPPAANVDAFQEIFAKAQQILVQSANVHLDALANRDKIVNEGIEKGKLLQLVELQNQKIAELTTAIQTIQSSGDDDDGRDYSGPPASVKNPQMGGMSPVIGMLLEKGLPVLLEKLGLNGTTAAVASEVVKGAASAPPNAENGGDGQQS